MAANREVLRLLRGLRIELGATVDQSVRDLTKAWAVAWDELAREWNAAIEDLIATAEAGQWPSRSQVYRADRAMRVLDITRDRLDQLADQAGVRILQIVPEVTTAAAEWQSRVVAAQMPAQAGSQVALTAAFDRVDPLSLEAIVTRTTQQVTSLTQPLSARATAAMNSTLVRGIALGDNPRRTAREMLRRVEGDFNGGLTRALTIARTETLDAHRAAAHAQDLANRDVLQAWEWLATLDHRTCSSCLGMHGTRHELDEQGPNDHQNGRCARVTVTKTWRELGFNVAEPPSVMPSAQDWFNDQDEATQLSIMGPARLELLQSGRISWTDLSTVRKTAGWRDSHAPTPVSALQALAA